MRDDDANFAPMAALFAARILQLTVTTVTTVTTHAETSFAA